MSKPNNNQSKPHNKGWTILETKVRGSAAIQVSILPLRVPRYSFRVGSAQFDEASGEVRLGTFVTIFNYEDAAELLKELGKKYSEIREARIDAVEALRDQWQKEHNAGDETDE